MKDLLMKSIPGLQHERWKEWFLLAALDAFFRDVPVIRTRVGGYEDMKDCVVGIPTNDVNAICTELNKWLSDPSVYYDQIKRAYDFAKKECTINTMKAKTIITYKKAIEICHS